ncbi:MAG: hypothetical protein OES25_03120 [Acidobacteriota bacterium]|nr:hypothetical protein [Acidobacteriota bacterium]
MLRFLLLLLAVIVAIWTLLARLVPRTRPARADAPRPTRRPAPTPGRRLVQDPACGVHIPEDRALSVETDQGRVFFCSSACRDSFLAASGSPGG